MRRSPLLRLLTVLALGFAGLHLPAAPSVAAAPPPADAPPGAVDGEPVGDWGPEADAAPSAGPEATSSEPTSAAAAAPPPRSLGAGALDAVEQAAAAAPPGADFDDALARMALTPVFGEAGAATSPSTAPSPMTLSRY